MIKGLTVTGFTGGGLATEAANNVTISCSHIGVDITGTIDKGNFFGVTVGNGSLLGGPQSKDRNVISGNEFFGVGAWGSAMVLNNHIGVDLLGNLAIGNDGSGVDVAVGGAIIGMQNQSNIISGNGGHGVNVRASAEVNSNRIGMGTAGQPMGNGGDGIRVTGATTIAKLDQNMLANNAGLGIDLGGDGVDTNDNGDGDSGPNGRLNHPVITTADPQGHSISLQSFAAGSYRLDYYQSLSCDESGFGEGGVWKGSIQPILGDTVHDSTNPVRGPAFTVLATSLTDGSVSEFSNCFEITPDVDCDGDGDAVDALAVLRKVAGLTSGNPQETTPCIANVNGDAIVDIRDALFIRRFAAGLRAP